MRSVFSAFNTFFAFTPCLLLGLSLGVTFYNLFANHTQCWAPAAFTHAMEDFAEKVCTTYGRRWRTNDVIPRMNRDENQDKLLVNVKLAQVVPLVFGFHAVLLMLFGRFWRFLENLRILGASPEDVIVLATDCARLQHTPHYDRALDSLVSVFRRRFGGFRLKQMCLSVIRILFAISVIGVCAQAVPVLSKVLMGKATGLNGYKMIMHAAGLNRYRESMPAGLEQTFLCEFKVRILGNTHGHTIQCATEGTEVFAIVIGLVWLWYCVLTAVSVAIFLGYLVSLVLGLANVGIEIKGVLDAAESRRPGSMTSSRALRALGPDGAIYVKEMQVSGLHSVTADIIERLGTPTEFIRPLGNESKLG